MANRRMKMHMISATLKIYVFSLPACTGASGHRKKVHTLVICKTNAVCLVFQRKVTEMNIKNKCTGPNCLSTKTEQKTLRVDV